MSTEEHTNWELIAKHLSGECNPEEEETLKSWIDSTPDNKATFEETKKIWEQSNSTQQNFNPDVDKAWAKVRVKLILHIYKYHTRSQKTTSFIISSV